MIRQGSEIAILKEGDRAEGRAENLHNQGKALFDAKHLFKGFQDSATTFF